MCKIHAIDYFCRQYDYSLGELAEYLGIKQPQINDWKKGRRNIPEKHRESMYKLFNIPSEYYYLLEVEYLQEIDKRRIEKLKYAAILENEPLESDIVPGILEMYKIKEREIELLKVLDKIKSNVSGSYHMEEKFKENISKLEKIIDEIK